MNIDHTHLSTVKRSQRYRDQVCFYCGKLLNFLRDCRSRLKVVNNKGRVKPISKHSPNLPVIVGQRLCLSHLSFTTLELIDFDSEDNLIRP